MAMHALSDGLFVDRAAGDGLGLSDLRLGQRRSQNHDAPVDARIGRAVTDRIVDPFEGDGTCPLVNHRLDFACRDQAVHVNRDLLDLGRALGDRLAAL